MELIEVTLQDLGGEWRVECRLILPEGSGSDSTMTVPLSLDDMELRNAVQALTQRADVLARTKVRNWTRVE